MMEIDAPQEIIKNISATRREAPNEQLVDIKFGITHTNEIDKYEVYAVPDDGSKTKRWHFTRPSMDPVQCLTMKELRKDVGYIFKVQAVFSDDTVSNVAQTESLEGLLPGSKYASNAADICLNIKCYYQRGKRIKNDKWVFEGHFSYGQEKWNDEDHKVAIKYLGASEYEGRIQELDAKESDKQIKRMVREAQHLRELIYHPNVVQYIFSCPNSDERQLLVFMELCSEKTLADRITDLGNHPEFTDNKYCKTVILHLAQAVHYMHSKRICHRDIKPSNVLFSLDDRVVKVSDFGFSKRACYGNGMTSSTRSTGTNGYRPPESCDETRRGKVKHLGDIFSLGLVYFYILTGGNHPYGGNAIRQQGNICDDSFSPVVEGLTGSDAALAKDLIRKMIDRDESKRTQDMAEILKHAYFWNVEKIIGFYVRAGDILSDKAPKGGINPEKLQGDIKYFFDVALNAAEISRAIIPSITQDTDQDQHKIQRKVEKQMFEKDAFNKLHEKSRHYIKVIQRALEMLSTSSAQPEGIVEADDASGIQSDVQAHVGDLSNCTSNQSPKESAFDKHTKSFWETPTYPEKNSVEDDLAKIVINELQQPNRLCKGKPCEALSNPKVRISFLDVISILNRFDISTQPHQPIDTNCGVERDFPLRTEFITRAHKDELEKTKQEMENLICDGNEGKRSPSQLRKIILTAKDLMKVFENIKEWRRKNAHASWESNPQRPHGNTKLGTSESEKDINKLTLFRQRQSGHNWHEFKMLVENLEDNNYEIEKESEFLKRIWTTASSLYQGEKNGSVTTWKECFTEEKKLHEIKCLQCPCVKLAENAMNANDTILGLVMYIRNKLVHFEDTKKYHKGHWMETQEHILTFVASAVPELLPHMVEVMKYDLAKYIQDNKQEDSSFLLPEIRKNQSETRGRVAPSGDVVPELESVYRPGPDSKLVYEPDFGAESISKLSLQ